MVSFIDSSPDNVYITNCLCARMTVIGVTSFGAGCGHFVPTSFGRVTAVRQWIQDTATGTQLRYSAAQYSTVQWIFASVRAFSL